MSYVDLGKTDTTSTVDFRGRPVKPAPELTFDDNDANSLFDSDAGIPLGLGMLAAIAAVFAWKKWK